LNLASLEDLEARLDVALADDPAGTPGPVLAAAMPVLGRIRNKQAALDLRASAAFEASKEWMANGSRSAAAWMAAKNREPVEVAKRRVRLGRALRGMPVVEAALNEGAITAEHVAVLNRELSSAVADRFVEDEADLVAKARTKRFVAFQRDVRYWRDAADPDGADDRARKLLESREWHASRSFEDQVFVNGRLDPIGGARYLSELQRLCDFLFTQDWAEATERLGEGNVTVLDLRRTAAERRADAQILMADRSANATTNDNPARPVLNIVMDWATFCAELARRQGRTDVVFPGERTCRLEDGTIIAPSQALSLGLAGFIRALVIDADGVPLHYGQSRRCFTGDLRTATTLTHDYCTHDAGCDVPSYRCEIDHIEAFTDGGPTDVVNAQPHCPPHNKHKETVDRKRRPKRRKGPQRSGGTTRHSQVSSNGDPPSAR